MPNYKRMFQIIWNDNVIYVIMDEYSLTEYHILALFYATVKWPSVTQSFFVNCIIIILYLIYGVAVLLCSNTHSDSLSFLYFIILNVSLMEYPLNI